MEPKNGLGWLKEWRFFVLLFLIGAGWARLETRVDNHLTGGPHKEALVRIGQLEKEMILVRTLVEKDGAITSTLLQTVLDRLDSLLEAQKAK